MAERAEWTEDIVVNVAGAEFASRLYIEHAALRAYMRRIAQDAAGDSACEVGSGYGRLVPVLKEFFRHVVGFEREPALLKKARLLFPAVTFREVTSLRALPAVDDEFCCALTFTVLQHLSDRDAECAIHEIKRVVSERGAILLCEDTEAGYVHDDPKVQGATFTIGRDVNRYKAWLEPWDLVQIAAREVERGEPRSKVGDYMLFQRPH